MSNGLYAGCATGICNALQNTPYGAQSFSHEKLVQAVLTNSFATPVLSHASKQYIEGFEYPLLYPKPSEEYCQIQLESWFDHVSIPLSFISHLRQLIIAKCSRLNKVRICGLFKVLYFFNKLTKKFLIPAPIFWNIF